MTTRTRSRFYPTALATLVVGLLLSGTGAWLLGQANHARITQAVDDAVQDTVDSIFSRVQLYQYGLRGARGAVLTSGVDAMSVRLFHRYSESRDIGVEFPGARGFGFVRRVPAGNEQAFLARTRADGRPGFAISTLRPHDDDRWIIEYIEPGLGNISAVGFDIASEPNRRRAAQEAVDNGDVRLTQPITLMQEQSKPQQSFLMLMPVYKSAKTPATVTERQRQLVGFAYAPLLMADVLQGLRIDPRLLHVKLSDVSDTDRDPTVFFSNSDDANGASAQLHPRRFQRDVFGRAWCFEFSVTPAFIKRLGIIPPVWIWLSGLLCSLVVAGLAGAIAVSRTQRREIAYARMELGALVESASDAIIGKSLEGIIRSWNRGAEQLFGYTAAETIGRPITRLIVPADRLDEENNMLARIGQGEPVSNYETVRVHKSGQHLHVAITTSPVYGANAQIIGASVTARDITLQRAQAAHIQNQNQELKNQVFDSLATTQAILDTVVDPVVSIDEQGTVLSFNPAGTRVFGYDAEEIIGQHVTHLMPQTSWASYNDFVSRHLEKSLPSSRSQEVQGLRKNGTVFPARVSVGLKHSGDGRVFVFVVTDITSEIKQRNELLAARDHLLLAADAAELGIWTFNLHGRSLIWNDRMFEMYGLVPTRSDLTLQYEDWLRCVYPDDIPRCEHGVDALIERGEPYNLVFRVRRPDGQLRYIQASGRAERDADGKPLRVTGINRDITLQQEIEAHLRQAKASADEASAAKSAFLANMSHEIRTPLNAVLGMLQLVQRTVLDTQQQDYIVKARQAAKSLLELLNDILDYSKIEAGKLKLDSHTFELDELLSELAVIIAGNQGARDVETVFDIDPSVPSRLSGDALRLKQVLVNLVGNALKFTLDGEVVIRLETVRREDDQVTLRFMVSDSGIGISEEQRHRIFEGFSQAEASTSRRFGGTGLGLVISNRLVSLMGGELKLDSKVGAGSRFWFDIPLQVQDRGEVPLPLPGDRLPLRLLVVDDNPISADVLSRTVRSLGWTAQPVMSGPEALEHVRRVAGTAAAYDLVLMDWRMPEVDGVATALMIQEALAVEQRPSIVMVTAYADRLSQVSAGEHKGLFACSLSKPVTPRQLRDCVLGVVEGRPMLPALPPADEHPKRLAGLHVLVVEDNVVNRQVAKGLLQLEGAEVTLAGNGHEALAALAGANVAYHVVLMDVQMPEMDGLEATRRIRQLTRFAQLPIIAMTANASTEDRHACLAAGMDDHISKPVDLAGLVKCVSEWVGRARPLTLPARIPEAEGSLLEAWPTVSSRFGGDLELLRNVLDIFATDTRDLLDRLQSLAPAGDRAAARSIFHAIKGSAANIGAKALSARAGKLEAGLERGEPEALEGIAKGTLAQELRVLLEDSEAQMRARLG
ncbi:MULTISPECIES: PAS domain-containing hybrid sensor histidine kinase/response regulator [Pseudomonas]|uniref:histidine kinase n=1 Tax=Pseudomonas quercus TaxID=2722792 RepID=A0ABX0Y8E4_9PSED|nr:MULTISPECIES: PAS domain S-box protein [Pseudomonas]MBF7141046.1 PAS domain S-box protein [Pseudomonas sp. LY10J]NJO99580.1 PAS domain S-box protein [Pseudomonas quercus]